MKKLILAILCLFLSSTLWAADPVQLARLNVGVAGAGGSAGACTDCASGCTFLGNNDETATSSDSGLAGYLLWPGAIGLAKFVAAQATVCELSAFVKGTAGSIRLAIVDSRTSTTTNVLCQTGTIAVSADYAWKGGVVSGGVLNCNLTVSSTYYIIMAADNNAIYINESSHSGSQLSYKTQATAGCTNNDCVANVFPAQINLGSAIGDAGDISMRIGYK